MHPLDRPVWASLTSFHASVSTGDALARRFNPEVNVFASARDDSPQALAALAQLVVPGERIFVLQVSKIAVPDGLVALKQAQGVQMVATRALRDPPPLPGMVELGDADASDMLQLARLTEPGPFLARMAASALTPRISAEASSGIAGSTRPWPLAKSTPSAWPGKLRPRWSVIQMVCASVIS
jgi:hypothetical protein